MFAKDFSDADKVNLDEIKQVRRRRPYENHVPADGGSHIKTAYRKR